LTSGSKLNLSAGGGPF